MKGTVVLFIAQITWLKVVSPFMNFSVESGYLGKDLLTLKRYAQEGKNSVGNLKTGN